MSLSIEVYGNKSIDFLIKLNDSVIGMVNMDFVKKNINTLKIQLENKKIDISKEVNGVTISIHTLENEKVEFKMEQENTLYSMYIVVPFNVCEPAFKELIKRLN